MSEDSSTQDPAAQDEPTTTEQLRADIEQTRAELAESVDALTSKLDVKGRASDKASHVTAQAKEKVTSAASAAKNATPDPVINAVAAVGEKAGPVVHQATQKAEPYRKQIAIGGAVAVLVLFVSRRRRKRHVV